MKAGQGIQVVFTVLGGVLKIYLPACANSKDLHSPLLNIFTWIDQIKAIPNKTYILSIPR